MGTTPIAARLSPSAHVLSIPSLSLLQPPSLFFCESPLASSSTNIRPQRPSQQTLVILLFGSTLVIRRCSLLDPSDAIQGIVRLQLSRENGTSIADCWSSSHAVMCHGGQLDHHPSSVILSGISGISTNTARLCQLGLYLSPMTELVLLPHLKLASLAIP